MKVLFLGFAVPDAVFEELLRTDRGMPVQTQRFGWSVLQALKEAGVLVQILSAEPASDYPFNRRIRFRGIKFSQNGLSGRTVSFVNVMALKHLSRYEAVLRLARRFGPGDVQAIVIHGVHSPFIWAGIRIARRLKIPVIVILTDPPSQPTPLDARGAGLLKKIDRRIILRGLALCDGVIALSSHLADDFASGKPAIVLEGIAPSRFANSDYTVPIRQGRKRVVYAGSLRREYGITELLAAAEIGEGDWILEVYGRGPAQVDVELASESSRRVRFGGFASDAELEAVYRDAALLVNPRPMTSSFVYHSFPSKLLEYLSSGRPVLSTRLPTIPAEYEELLNWCDPDRHSLAVAIDEVVGHRSEESETKAAAAKTYVLDNKGSLAQGFRMRNFVEDLYSARMAID